MENKKRAFVLSGGGAVGAYEIGVWQALRKMKIDFDIAVGTSVGALNAIMVVQKDFKKAYKIWRNISYNDIYEEKIDSNINKKDLYKKYAKEIIQKGGMNPAMLENLLNMVFDENKFFASNIDYGLITVSLSSLKPVIKRKKDLTKEDVTDYAIASATCFPAFKVKDIKGEKYIDGGYYDNMPINLAIDMGATDIIAVDLNQVGITRKTKKFNGTTTIIKPHNKLLNMLDFEASKTRIAIKFGYNDTMKKYNLLDGNKFTFKKNNLKRNYLKHQTKFEKVNLDLKTVNKIIEDLGHTFNFSEVEIYHINKYNRKLKKILKETGSLDLKKLVKDKQVKEIFDKRKVIKTIYNNLDFQNKKLLTIIAQIFKKEYLAALYLRIIK